LPVRRRLILEDLPTLAVLGGAQLALGEATLEDLAGADPPTMPVFAS
jgi:hypothetical protein